MENQRQFKEEQKRDELKNGYEDTISRKNIRINVELIIFLVVFIRRKTAGERVVYHYRD